MSNAVRRQIVTVDALAKVAILAYVVGEAKTEGADGEDHLR